MLTTAGENLDVAIDANPPLDIDVIIPTLNPGRELELLIRALLACGVKSDQIFVVDSSSTDGCVEAATLLGARSYVIPRQDFGHGKTRKLAVELTSAPVLVFLTQDAIPADPAAINELCAPLLGDNPVSLCFGRQIPKPGAKRAESFARRYNYGDESYTRELADAVALGPKVTFCSNSFSAYLRSDLLSIGNFSELARFSEDQIVAALLLNDGKKIAYSADAKVYHSHSYNYEQEFRRYFDIGVFRKQFQYIFAEFGPLEGEGMKYVMAELAELEWFDLVGIFDVIIRSAAKYIGFRMGLVSTQIPKAFKDRLSMFH